MKNSLLILFVVPLIACQIDASRELTQLYDPNDEYPFGRKNPAAPVELSQFHFMVGQNDCEEQRLNNVSGEWVAGIRSWDAHYYMNGYAIRDGGASATSTNGNIRIFDPSEKQWNVTFFSMPAYSSGVWKGVKEGGNIVLKQAQKAPGTDFDGFSTLTFSNISAAGFDWSGEWISEDGSVVFPFWRVQCRKVNR